MAKQLFWEDVEVGNDIPTMPKVASTRTNVKWAGAVGDYNPLHYEDDFAEAQRVGKPLVYGQLKRSWLVQLLTDWMGDEGTLKKFSCQFRGQDHPRGMKTMHEVKDGETWLCKGKVTKKYVEGDLHLVDCEVSLENGQGKVTTPGNATVILPSRK